MEILTSTGTLAFLGVSGRVYEAEASSSARLFGKHSQHGLQAIAGCTWSQRFFPSETRRHSLLVRKAAGEVPQEILEDEKFAPLKEDDPRYGPPVLFLLGFDNKDASRVQEMLREMEGDFMRIILCTSEMVKGTLGQAISTVQGDVTAVRIAANLPPICFLSGLTGEEIMTVIQSIRDVGYRQTIFAAHVPLNTNKYLEELIEEIMGDHNRLSKPSQPTPT